MMFSVENLIASLSLLSIPCFPSPFLDSSAPFIIARLAFLSFPFPFHPSLLSRMQGKRAFLPSHRIQNRAQYANPAHCSIYLLMEEQEKTLFVRKRSHFTFTYIPLMYTFIDPFLPWRKMMVKNFLFLVVDSVNYVPRDGRTDTCFTNWIA